MGLSEYAAGLGLGAGTALIGKEAAMACTVAVEAVISEHYNKYDHIEYVFFLKIDYPFPQHRCLLAHIIYIPENHV